MQRKNDICRVGFVHSPHGIHGELYVEFDQKSPDWLPGIQKFHLEAPNKRETKTLTLENIRPHKKGFLIQFREITDRDRADFMKGWSLGIPYQILETQPGEEFYLAELKGFRVFSGGESLGTVAGFSSNGAQELLILRLESNNLAEIPWVVDWLQQVDFKNQKIEMALPSGLLEINS